MSSDKAYVDALTKDLMEMNRGPTCTLEQASRLTSINTRLIKEAVNTGKLTAHRTTSGKTSNLNFTCRRLALWIVELEKNSIPRSEAA